MQFKLLGVQSCLEAYYFPTQVLLELHTNLWYQLSYPHTCEVSLLIYELAVQLERIFHLHFPALSRIKFHATQLIQTPSLQLQIIFRPSSILDPYILALRDNYYYPLAQEELTMQEDTHMQGGSPSHSPKRNTTVVKPITVESSLQAITDLIKEVEADDPPTESTLQATLVDTPKNVAFTH
jgi:hypothetical protein